MSARGRRHNAKGRSQHGPPFVQLHLFMLDSLAWLQLTVYARSAYVELARRYNGSNNGSIGFSSRTLAERLRCSKDTAAKALRELEDAGFIDTVRFGTFVQKNRKASEYRLNAFRCDLSGHPPSKKFMAFQAVPRSGIRDRTVRDGGQPVDISV